MACKMLFFDYKESDGLYFEKNEQLNFEIKFLKNSLNKKTVKDLSDDDLEQTSALSVYTPSLLSADVINEFPNLRIISTRSKEYKHIDLKTCLDRNIAVVNIDNLDKDTEFHILHASFRAINSVFCGCKENRIV